METDELPVVELNHEDNHEAKGITAHDIHTWLGLSLRIFARAIRLNYQRQMDI